MIPRETRVLAPANLVIRGVDHGARRPEPPSLKLPSNRSDDGGGRRPPTPGPSQRASVLLGNGSTTTSFQGLSRISGVSVATQSAALEAQDRIDSHLDDVNVITGVVGSALSRFAVAANLLSASAEATKAAGARITDVDVAEESALLVSTGILQEADSAVLAHAIKGPELARKLLRA